MTTTTMDVWARTKNRMTLLAEIRGQSAVSVLDDVILEAIMESAAGEWQAKVMIDLASQDE